MNLLNFSHLCLAGSRLNIFVSKFTMRLLWTLILIVLYNGCSSEGVNSTLLVRPKVVNIGCMLSFNTVVGKVTKVAVEAAVEDINSNPNVLGGTKLNMITLDSNSSGFLGIVEGKLVLCNIYNFAAFVDSLFIFSIIFLCSLSFM